MSPQYLLKYKPNVFIWTKIKLQYVTTTTKIILIQKLTLSNLGFFSALPSHHLPLIDQFLMLANRQSSRLLEEPFFGLFFPLF